MKVEFKLAFVRVKRSSHMTSLTTKQAYCKKAGCLALKVRSGSEIYMRHNCIKLRQTEAL